MKPSKILFFINGMAPTVHDRIEAEALGAQICYRNAHHVPTDPHALEECDGVAGEVPQIYADKYPAAEDAIAARLEKLQALATKVGDAPAPRQKVEPSGKQQSVPKKAWGVQ